MLMREFVYLVRVSPCLTIKFRFVQKYISKNTSFKFMTDTTILHMHDDLEDLKKDVAVIKHILSQGSVRKV